MSQLLHITPSILHITCAQRPQPVSHDCEAVTTMLNAERLRSGESHNKCPNIATNIVTTSVPPLSQAAKPPPPRTPRTPKTPSPPPLSQHSHEHSHNQCPTRQKSSLITINYPLITAKKPVSHAFITSSILHFTSSMREAHASYLREAHRKTPSEKSAKSDWLKFRISQC